METLRVDSLNINGARDVGKRSVGEYVKQKQVQVLFLQETHSDVLNEVDWGLWWKGASVLSHGTDFSGGVAVLFAAGLFVWRTKHPNTRHYTWVKPFGARVSAA